MWSGAAGGITPFVIFSLFPIHLYRNCYKTRDFHKIWMKNTIQIVFKPYKWGLRIAWDPLQLISMIFEIWALLRGQETLRLWSQLDPKRTISPRFVRKLPSKLFEPYKWGLRIASDPLRLISHVKRQVATQIRNTIGVSKTNGCVQYFANASGVTSYQ